MTVQLPLSLTRSTRPYQFGVTLGLSLLLLACSSPNTTVNPDVAQGTATPSPSAESDISSGQMLPITAEAEIRGQRIQLEVARTPEQQAMGLMYRRELADDRGMLFPFAFPRPAQFWMRNTLIPLDMLFLLNGEVKAIAANAAPCTTPTCPLYESGVPVNQVIELRGGRAAELGIQVGDRITIRTLPAPNNTQ
ncbi:DUF192 domain-containing protein [Oscillatoria sp. FACHB-1407]|uniref:DUF192 domain-containing protein n=1 Tax=Oscillatoria sp. FACHB-1407 TaxID=2692847 RepID=UPI00168373AC|nr:DUF192 domain-containing protein [Oscillatoria sp. FACHB-1407]MBD2460111.1 DUF192 domain-containing protein [Oscillatoria sp. FACHB-1407]